MSKTADYPATIRASILTRIVHALDQALDGTTDDADALLLRNGLRRSELLDPYAAIPLQSYVALLEAAAARIGDNAFGRRIGAMLQPADLGPAGLLLVAAPTLREGIARFHRYIATVQSATQVALHDDGGSAWWTYRVEDVRVWPRAQDSELTLAAMCGLFRARLGARWSPLEVHFEHTGHAADPTLRDVFQNRVAFDQPTNGIHIATADLDRRLIVEGADVTAILERHADDLIARRAGIDEQAILTLADRVRRHIAAQLGVAPVTLAGVAHAFGLSTRSLQRDLAADGTSLRDLLREHRRTLAEQRLRAGTSRHAAIAQAMGYSDSTVFWRAFKRWNGTAPRTFRGTAAKPSERDD